MSRLNNFDLMTAARRWPARSMGERFTLLILVTYAGLNGDNEWTCWPGVATLAEDTLQHAGTVRRHLAAFKEQGLIEQRRRPAREGRGRQVDEIVLDVELLTKRAQGAVEVPDQARPSDRSSAPESTVQARIAGDRALQGKTKRTTTEPASSVDDAPASVVQLVQNLESSVLDARVEALCTYLADRVEQHRRGDRPKITERSRKDMRLLLERGPLHVDKPEPLTVEKVRASIDAVFNDLATPDGRGFCWADQVRSPAALRDHYTQLRQAWRRVTGSQVGRGAQAVDRVAQRLGAEGGTPTREPLGLLSEHEPKELNA